VVNLFLGYVSNMMIGLNDIEYQIQYSLFMGR